MSTIHWILWVVYLPLRLCGGLPRITVVGSINVDVTMEVARLPERHETLTASKPAVKLALGGKGANQAVAAARLGAAVRFVGRVGADAHGAWLLDVLNSNGVDTSGCTRSETLPSGQGMVMLDPEGGASSVVVGGANVDWASFDLKSLDSLLEGSSVLLLQQEILAEINLAAAQVAKAKGVIVMHDVGGEEREISQEFLELLDFVCPNEGELQRLTKQPTGTREEVLSAASTLFRRVSTPLSVLVTLGARGALLVSESAPPRAATPVPVERPVDATAAGDAFRAALAVALAERQPLPDALRLASAAGGLAVSRQGAEPSLPWRAECEALLSTPDAVIPAAPSATAAAAGDAAAPGATRRPRFASRLNSMKDRPELWDGPLDVLGLIARQGHVRGLELVYLNFPQHLETFDISEASTVLRALQEAKLQAGGLALRFPEHMGLGAFTNPNETVRKEAVDLTLRACVWAEALDANEVVVWPQTDGYDYQLQVDYLVAWSRAVDAFREVLDSPSCRNKKVSLEFKPTDEISRFAIVPSTGAALLFAQQVNRENFGLTLDVGHLLMAGENPAQSIAMVGAAGKLFGVHLNDGHSRLGAEDGLVFGSVHPTMALELVVWLKRVEYQGAIYFDTFPHNEDPVREAELNIRRFERLERRAQQLESQLKPLQARHDAMGVLELLE